jgi:hypothetical protein
MELTTRLLSSVGRCDTERYETIRGVERERVARGHTDLLTWNEELTTLELTLHH